MINTYKIIGATLYLSYLLMEIFFSVIGSVFKVHNNKQGK